VEVEGSSVPLYPAPDGSGRFYLEAREGARYAVTLANRTHERLGVVLTVDGLNAISGDRDPAGRMYVLNPWDSASVKGWRTSLDDVRRFTFVDERASYAARSGKANARMGWIEVAVYRERPRPYVYRTDPYRTDPYEGDRSRDEARKAPEAPDEAQARGGKMKDEDGRERPSARRRQPLPPALPRHGLGRARRGPRRAGGLRAGSGAGGGSRSRYEYANALRALGILPAPWWARDRLPRAQQGEERLRPAAAVVAATRA
jgi:hypothetical protein